MRVELDWHLRVTDDAGRVRTVLDADLEQRLKALRVPSSGMAEVRRAAVEAGIFIGLKRKGGRA